MQVQLKRLLNSLRCYTRHAFQSTRTHQNSIMHQRHCLPTTISPRTLTSSYRKLNSSLPNAASSKLSPSQVPSSTPTNIISPSTLSTSPAFTSSPKQTPYSSSRTVSPTSTPMNQQPGLRSESTTSAYPK